MKFKSKIRRLIASALVLAMLLSNIGFSSAKNALAAESDNSSTTYLNAAQTTLHLGDKNDISFDFNIKKAAKKAGSTYAWYINSKKGNSKAVSINKKTGLVTANEAGEAYIGCKITLKNKKVVSPEAKVIVRNNITKVDISNLPDNNTISALADYGFNKEILNTQGGIGKSSKGITRWEISDDTAGVDSISDNGVVCATQNGTFKIRCISFESSSKYSQYLKEKNAKYITAASKWYTIKVTPAADSVTVNTQKQLNQVLDSNDVTNIYLSTDKSEKFTIAKGDYSNKSIVVNAPNADMNNYGLFKQITIKAIKDSTWIEFVDGNRIYLSDTKLRIIINSDADVKEIVFDIPNTLANLEINGKVDKITVLQPVTVNVSGSSEGTRVSVEDSAAGSTIFSSVDLNLTMQSDVNVILSSGSEGTVLDRSNSSIDVKVNNQTQRDIIITTNGTNATTVAAGENMIGDTTPTVAPTAKPTTAPPIPPITVPTTVPTTSPTSVPTTAPTAIPTTVPTATPTSAPNDHTAPAYSSFSIIADRKTATFTFSEAIINNYASMEELKNNITTSMDNGVTLHALDAGDSVSINNNQLVINFSNALYQENAKIIIAANSLKDSSGNVSTGIIMSDVINNMDNTPSTATALTIGGAEQISKIDPFTDEDWYSFNAKAGMAYIMRATYPMAGVPVKISLYDTDGITLLASAYFNPLATSFEDYMMPRLSYGCIKTGTYYIKTTINDNIIGAPDENCIGTYGITVSENNAMSDEPNDTPQQATLLTVGEVKQENWLMPNSDTDYYKFDADAGVTYNFFVRNTGVTGGLICHLYDTDGITKLADSVLGSITFTPTVSGIYYISIRNYSYETNNPTDADVEEYVIMSSSNVMTATQAVIDAEKAVQANPENAYNEYENAKNFVSQLPISEVKNELQARLDTVKSIMDQALLADINSTNEMPDLITKIVRLFYEDFMNLPLEKQRDISILMYSQNAPVDGTMGFTSISEVETALDKAIQDYDNLLVSINNASDVATMKAVLDSASPIYSFPVPVPDLFAKVVLDERPVGGYASVNAVRHVTTTAQVTFNTARYTPQLDYPYYTCTAGGGGSITATVDGKEIHSGDSVEKGKSVVFTYTPADEYDNFNWYFDDSGRNSLSNENTYTLTDITKPINLELRVVKTPTITVIPPVSYSLSGTGNLFIPVTYTDAYLIRVFSSWDGFIDNLIYYGNCSIVDGGILINKDYLSNIGSGNTITFTLDFNFWVKQFNIQIID